MAAEIQADDEHESRLRPVSLDGFQGQDTIKENLAVFIAAARRRNEPLDHVFLSGPPGLGKTTLAGILAQEMKGEFKVTSAPALEKPKDLIGLLTTMAEGTVFFIDEIHRLKPALEEMLYIAMEDFEIDWIIGQGPSARSIRIPLPKFTLVGATTRAGLVATPLYTRFGINVRIDYYSAHEIARVLRRTAGILAVELDEDGLAVLSRCSRGTPRIANRLLRRMRDFADVFGDGTVNRAIVEKGLGRLEIDALGLEKLDRDILAAIVNHYGGGPVGAETLAITVGESIDTLEDFYEPYLIQQGLLQRTPRGRMVTAQAYGHLGLPLPERPERSKGMHEDQGILF